MELPLLVGTSPTKKHPQSTPDNATIIVLEALPPSPSLSREKGPSYTNPTKPTPPYGRLSSTDSEVWFLFLKIYFLLFIFNVFFFIIIYYYYLILIIYKIYIYDITGSTDEPWTGNFFSSMTGLVMKTLENPLIFA